MGDRPQLLCAVLAIRYGRTTPVIAGLAVATLFNCLLSARAGVVVNQWVSEAPVLLFYGLSLVLAGIAMLAWRRPVDLLENWRGGAFLTSAIGLFILQLGDKGQFIVAATAARTDQWLLAALGGWSGIMLACVPAILLQERLATMLPMTAIRRCGGILLLIAGLIAALLAWGLIG